MEWKQCLTASEKSLYLKFIKTLYKDDPFYVDYTTPVLNEIFAGKSPFAQNLWHESYWIMDSDELVGVLTYLIHKNYSDVLQVAFLEYLDLKGLPELILDHAYQIAKDKGVKEIVVGLNGHVNYGLGLSVEQSHRPTFGSVYTKAYYSKHFKALGLEETKLVSFQYPWESKEFPLSLEKKNRFYGRFKFRIMQKETFDSDIEIYTALNNKCFGEHPFYFPRTVEEDRFLFKDLKFFMEKGSLIFAEDDGKPIGFLLWYPDWGEIMRRGETLSVITFIRKILFGKKVKGFKIVEWAVLPEYRRKGVPVGLLAHCYELVKDRQFTKCKTSWIVEANKDSSGFGDKWAEPYERYAVYTMKL
ncbi:MAG: GNAT family N-acetyltransferase [Clostridia bacterium]|nr:GNAT family N-acetyltransferase [Clostridia bacterium]